MEDKKKNIRRTAAIEIPQAQTFSPTMEEFEDFSKYIKSLEEKGAHYAGIVKIKPPKEWCPRKVGYNSEDFKFRIKRPIKQVFKAVGEVKGCYQSKSLAKTPLDVDKYREMTQIDKYAPPEVKSYDELEQKYWKALRAGNKNEDPVYGADVAETITDPEVTAFNIAKLDSLLKHLNEDTGQVYFGVNSPYLYFGMWKATFSWHVEDMDLYAINFLHYGKPKTWYCVPPKYGHLLEGACRQMFPNVSKLCSNFMRHKTCLVEPKVLEEYGVPYQKIVQEERDIIVVFPYAYHSGFNHGFNIAESTNFALERWIEYGKYYHPCDCSVRGVKINMDTYVKRFQPDRYDDWIAGRDIRPHPEDPPDKREQVELRAKNPGEYAKKVENERYNLDPSMLAEVVGCEDEDYEALDGSKYAFDPRKMELRDQQFEADMKPEEKDHFKKYKDERECVTLDNYEHIELTKLRVAVYPDTFKCSGKGLDRVREILAKPDLESIKELIDRGEMIRLGSKLRFRKIKDGGGGEHDDPKPLGDFKRGMNHPLEEADVKKEEVETDAEKPDLGETAPKKKMMKEEKVKAYLYKHVCEDVDALVRPDTYEILGWASPRLLDFLQHTSMEELINLDIFQFEAAVDVIIDTELPGVGGLGESEKVVSTAPPQETSSPKKKGPKAMVHTYEDIESKEIVRVSATRKNIVGGISDALRSKLGLAEGEKCIKEAISKKLLKLVESAPSGMVIEKTYERKTKRIKFYRHAEKGELELTLNADTMKPRGRVGGMLKTVIEKKPLAQCLEDGDFRLVGEWESGVSRPKPANYAVKSYKVMDEGINYVDVAAQMDRVVYRFKKGDGGPVHELFRTSKLNELIDMDKLVEINCKKVEREEDLVSMLTYEASYADVVEHRVESGENDDTSVVQINQGNGQISDKDRSRFGMGDKTYDTLMREGTLLPNPTVVDKVPHVEEKTKRLLKTRNNKSLTIEGDVDTGQYVIWQHDRREVYVIKDEQVKHESLDDDLNVAVIKIEHEGKTEPEETVRKIKVVKHQQVKKEDAAPPPPTPTKKEVDSDEYESEGGFVSEVSSSEVDSDDNVDDFDRDSPGGHSDNDSDDSDFYGTEAERKAVKRKKAMLSRQERSAKRAKITADVAGNQTRARLTESLLKLFKEMRKMKPEKGEDRLRFDMVKMKAMNVALISMVTALPVLRGLHIVEEEKATEVS
jgi:jumonji domain-containing protein 2